MRWTRSRRKHPHVDVVPVSPPIEKNSKIEVMDGWAIQPELGIWLLTVADCRAPVGDTSWLEHVGTELLDAAFCADHEWLGERVPVAFCVSHVRRVSH